MDYRSWLQQQVNSHSDANTRKQAAAVLQRVGNDQNLDQGWLNNPLAFAFGRTDGYGKQSIINMNDNFKGMYAADMQKIKDSPIIQAQPANSGGNSGGSTGGGGGSYGGGTQQQGLTAAQRATIDSQWAQNNQYYNDLLGSIDPRKAAAQQGIDRQVNTSTAALGSERDAAYQNLDRQDTKLEKGYAQGRQSLGEQIRNTLQGQSNNIGMLGGGNSSAIQMLGVGVADVQNQEQGKMLDDLNEQKTDIEINRQQVKQKLDDELRKLNDFKISKYQEIQDQFNSERNEILNKLNANDNQRAQALASAGAAATQYLQAVDSTIKNRLSQIADTYKNIQGPAVSLSSVPAYQATNIAGPSVSLEDQPQAQLTPDQATQSVLPRRTDDDTMQYLTPRRDTNDQFIY